MTMGFREGIGRLWGQTTTQILALLVVIQPVLSSLDPDLMTPTVRWGIFGVTLTMAVLRFIAPPPPSVPIHTGDEVEVDRDMGTVTVTKVGAIPSDVVSKMAGEKT